MNEKIDLNALDAADARYLEQFRNLASERLRDYVESITDSAPTFGNNAFICPACKSGTGNNNKFTPAFFLFRHREGGLRYKCHACDITGDIFDLAGLVNGTDSFIEQQRIIAAFLGIDLDERTPLDHLQVIDALPEPPSQLKPTKMKQEAAAYIKECQRHVSQTDYFRSRGLSQEIIERFHLGYDPVRNWAVIPFTPAYYIARNAAVKADMKGEHKHHKPRGLKQPLFNFPALAKKREPVFLTEAPLDALSIIQAGGNAAALGGSSTGVLRSMLGMYQPDTFFILAMDNDGPGRRLTEGVSKILTGQVLPYSIPLHPAFTDYKDANAALMADPGLLVSGVAEERNRALALWEQERGGVGFTKTVNQMKKQRS